MLGLLLLGLLLLGLLLLGLPLLALLLLGLLLLGLLLGPLLLSQLISSVNQILNDLLTYLLGRIGYIESSLKIKTRTGILTPQCDLLFTTRCGLGQA